jgi:hypothetical protein
VIQKPMAKKQSHIGIQARDVVAGWVNLPHLPSKTSPFLERIHLLNAESCTKSDVRPSYNAEAKLLQRRTSLSGVGLEDLDDHAKQGNHQR